MSRIEESRRQFVHWARWKKAGGTVEQDPQAAEIDDLIARMPTPLKQTLAEVYLQGGEPSERAGRDRPENRIVRRLNLIRRQVSFDRFLRVFPPRPHDSPSGGHRRFAGFLLVEDLWVRS